jgi:hypothetical protein
LWPNVGADESRKEESVQRELTSGIGPHGQPRAGHEGGRGGRRGREQNTLEHGDHLELRQTDFTCIILHVTNLKGKKLFQEQILDPTLKSSWQLNQAL